MNIIYVDDLNKVYLNNKSNACIGNFDCFHLGHQKLIDKLNELYEERTLITFTPHPIKALIDKNYNTLLTDNDKINLLNNKIDNLVFINFSEEISKMSYVDFIKFLHINNIESIICGNDFHFGYKAQGSVDNLKNEFKTFIVEDFKIDNILCKTQNIKNYLTNGNIELANKLLGYNYKIKGIITKGNQKGREIGFPTANISNCNYFIPKCGVYATKTIVGGKTYLSMTNIGHNPTFNLKNEITVETNILDFNEIIYDKEIEIEFYFYIRDEVKFSSKEELIKELQKNQDFVRKNLQL